MLSVQVTISGDKQTIANLRKLGDKLEDFSTAMRSIGSELKSYYGGQVFASEGGATGKRWADLSPVYRSYKSKHYPGRGILVRTGAMQRSFTSTSGRNSTIIGNSKSYFGYVQQGTRRMPARPVFVINNDVKDIVGNIIDADIKQKLASVT